MSRSNPDERVVVIGAGGHARVVMDSLRRAGRYELAGLLDPGRRGAVVDGVPVLGGDELLPKLVQEGVRLAVVGVGSTGDNAPRERIFEAVRAAGLSFANAIHPDAVVAETCRIGSGVAIMAGAIVNAGASLGDNVVINTGAIVEHDCVVEDHAQVAPGAVLCGGVELGRGAHVGAGATVLQGVCIGEFALIGAGAVVVNDVPARARVAGVPARALEDKATA